MEPRPVNFVPGVGVDDLRFGAMLDEVKARLDPSRKFVKSNDDFTWESTSPECVWCFAKSGNGDVRLRQVIADVSDLTINGVPLQGHALDECLSNLGVKSFNETLWCRENVFLDYKDGEQIPNQQRSREKDIRELLSRGTLWIKSQGLGLHMVDGKVASIANCLPRDVPQVGCGPLTGDDITVASDPARVRKKLARKPTKQSLPKASGSVLSSFVAQTVLFICAIVSIAVPLYWSYQRYEYWKDAESKQGTAVGVEMQGPFVESLDVMYLTADERKHHVKVPAMKTDARKAGDKVDLWYKKSQPEVALARQQIEEDAFETYGIYNLGGVILAQAIFAIRSFGKRKTKRV